MRKIACETKINQQLRCQIAETNHELELNKQLQDGLHMDDNTQVSMKRCSVQL